MSAWVFTGLWTSECLVNVEWFCPLYASSFWKGLRAWDLSWLVESCWDWWYSTRKSLVCHGPLFLLSLHCLADVGFLWENKYSPFTDFFFSFQIKECPHSHPSYMIQCLFLGRTTSHNTEIYHLFYVTMSLLEWISGHHQFRFPHDLFSPNPQLVSPGPDCLIFRCLKF